MKTRILSFFLLAISISVLAQKPSKKDHIVTISTSFGDMLCILHEQTPKHKANFIKLAEEGFYDSTCFHRVIKNFMIQGGDPNSKDENPNNDGVGGPGYTIEAEFVGALKHKKGALCAARQGDGVNPKRNSSGSQFYIVHTDNGARHLDGQYTVFGQVIKGLECIDTIAQQECGGRYGSTPTVKIPVTVKVEELKKKKITKLYGYEY